MNKKAVEGISDHTRSGFVTSLISLPCNTRNFSEREEEADMAVVSSKAGNQGDSFNVFKQKVGKQTSSLRGFKQHFSVSAINQDKHGQAAHHAAFAASKEEVKVEEQRGFVPSDVLNDPNKREFLTQLSKRMWMEKEKFLSKCRVQ